MITNIKDYKLYLESIVKQSNDKEIFNYKSTQNDLWRPIIKQAQDFQQISFDLENNESYKDKRKIYIKKMLRKDQPVKVEIACELYEAAGDWEFPVLYFKIEFIHQYNVIDVKYSENPIFVWDLKDKIDSRKFVLIPPIEAGNKLYKNDKGNYQAHTDETINSKDYKITPKDVSAAWRWLETLLNNVVNHRWKMLDRPANDPEPTISDTKAPTPITQLTSENLDKSVVTIIKEDNNYNIHHNGDTPYIIRHSDNVNQVILYQRVETFEYKKIFEPIVGEGQDKNNTILLQIEDDKYVYIGHKVYEFKTKDKIKEYYSFIGNSDVPYPVAVGEEFVYFMLNKQFVPKSEFHEGIDWLKEAYNAYYGHTYKDLNLTKMDFNIKLLF